VKRAFQLSVLIFCLVLLTGALAVDLNASQPTVQPPSVPLPQGTSSSGQPPRLLGAIQSIQDPLPTTGNQPLLVILADFPDKAGTLTGQAWVDFFWGAQGFNNFYQEISYWQLAYPGDISDVVGAGGTKDAAISAYVRMPQPITYYANNYFGYNTGTYPQNLGGVVHDALQALDAGGFDFSPYEDPITHKVENLIVIFAGANYGYTRDAVNSLEATAYTLTDMGLGSPYTTSGGQLFDNFTFCPELFGGTGGGIAKIGICSHEHGHALGMFDLYNLSYATSGVGYFDLMGYGAYGSDAGTHPFHPSAFVKEYNGWNALTDLGPGAYSLTLAPIELGGNGIRLYPDGNTSNKEYFVLENRQALGYDYGWTGAGLCTGLVIWHIDGNIVEAYALSNLVNSPGYVGGPPHPGVLVVEADGNFDMIKTHFPPSLNYGQCADTWAVGRTWSDNTTPDAHLWDGTPSNLSVRVADEVDGSLHLVVRVGMPVFDQTAFLPTVSK
jgi:M6 family metalloprotease-like protein